jgi:lysine 2,3-aminomutase
VRAASDGEIDAMVEYIRRTPQVRDVIVSGGDPLTFSSRKLETILARVRAIRHVEMIRIGTRMPVVMPQRIDVELVRMLKKYRPLWLNTHFNHPRELTPEAAEACDRILCSGIPINNQSVLLRGVNDNVQTMLDLCHGLLKVGVRPYYIFQCDPVRGTEHFRTSIWRGIDIIEGMRGHTSGLAIPFYVVDAPDGGGKIPLQPNYLLSMSDDTVLLRNYEGAVFTYRNPSRPGLGDDRPVIERQGGHRLNHAGHCRDQRSEYSDQSSAMECAVCAPPPERA